jgi:hypothetical protein
MPATAMALRCGVMLCNQRCKTRVYIKDGVIYNAMNDEVHKCPISQRAREFEGYFNMMQIDTVKPLLNDLEKSIKQTQLDLNGILLRIEYYEAQNKPLAEAFVKRKQRTDKKRPQPATKPEINIASELLTK